MRLRSHERQRPGSTAHERNLFPLSVRPSTAAGEVVFTIMAAVAQMIRKQTGEKTRAVLRDS